MIREENDGLWIELKEVIAAHHDDVFGTLTTPEGLKTWFPVEARVDLRAGGKVVFCWDKDCTKTTTVAILDYDAGGKVVWDWFADATQTHAPVYWQITPDSEKGSIVSQGPFRDDRESMIGMAHESAHWQWHMCNLRSVLESRHDMRAHRPL